MVKLLVIARVIPEDTYLRSVEQNIPITPILERKFRVPVRDPETWYVGRLAIEIKNCYERIYKSPLGVIKYLKDDEDDCDLDPEQSVSDLLIDEGKAARDGSDQRVTVKIIQEQGRALRAGSVIPDLSRAEYQPPARPPVPKFSENKRAREDQYEEAGQVKRRRLGQIEEEESENLIHSIEQDGERAPSHFELQDARFLSALQAGAFSQIHPKIESPELPPWKNPHPATRDELEILPEAPKDLHFRARRIGLPLSGPRRSRELEIGESSENNFDLNRRNSADLRGSNHGHPNPVLQHTSRPSAPFTPPDTGSTRQTSRGQAVSMLNGMKSASPADRQPSSRSAKKFRKPGTNGPGIYEHPESDIDDSQMSPGSRNSRRDIAPKPVTPRLVSSLLDRRQTPYSETSRHERDSTANTSDYTNHASRNSEAEHLRLSHVNSVSTAGQLAVNNHLETRAESERSDTSREQSGFNPQHFIGHQAGESAVPPRPSSKRAAEDDEPSTSVKYGQTSEYGGFQRTDADATRKKARTQQNSHLEGHRVRKSKSRSGSAEPSENSSSRSDQPSRSHTARTNEDEGTAGTNEGDTTEELDGPGEQLLQNLNQNSPERSRHSQVITNVPPRKTEVLDRGKGKQVRALEDAEREEIERPPLSDIESDMGRSRKEKKKHTGAKPKSSKKQQQKNEAEEKELRCLTCWRKKSKCDNRQPKCTACEKNRKNCQEYALTSEEADQIYAERRTLLGQKSKPEAEAKSSGKLIDQIKNKVQTESDQRPLKKGAIPTNKGNITTIANSQSDVADIDRSSGPRPTSNGSTKASRSSEQDQTHDRQNEEVVCTKKKVLSKKPISKPSNKIDESSKASRPESRSSSNMDATEPTSRSNPQLSATDRLRQERSTESQVSAKIHILPPGMTQEQYDNLISSRSQLTDEQRKADNLRFRKSESRKEATPGIVSRSVASDAQSRTSKDAVRQNGLVKQVSQSSSDDSASEESNIEVKKTEPVKKIPSSSQSSARDHGRKSLPATQPSNGSTFQISTPGPAKSIPQPATEPAKSKGGNQKQATPIPITAAEKASVVKNNPPFRPHKALANSSFTAVNKSVPVQQEASIGQAKSLSGLRNILDKKKSSSSTPQPNSAMDRLVAETLKASARLNGFSFGAEDEEEETESESDDDDQQGKENHNFATNIGKSPVGTLRNKPTAELDSGSGSSDENGV